MHPQLPGARSRVGVTAAIGIILGSFVASVAVVAHFLARIENPATRYALSFTAVQSGILAVLIVGLAVAKRNRVRQETARSHRIRKLQELVTEGGASLELGHKAVEWPDEFLTVIQDSLAVLKGSESQRVLALVRNGPGYDRLLAEAADKEPGVAYRAVSILGEMEGDEPRAAVRRALAHPAELVRMTAHRAILMNGRLEARLAILNRLPVLSPWERIVLFHAVPVDSELLGSFLSGAFSSDDDPLSVAALDLVFAMQRLMPVTVPQALAGSRNPEVRIKFYKALPFFPSDGELAAILRQGLHDEDWRVRAMAARACGYFQVASLAGDLLAMCTAFAKPAEAGHAARALAAMGGEARARLERMAISGSNAGQQIASEVVEKQLIASGGARP